MKQRSKSKSFSIQTLILKIVIVWAIVAFVIYPNLNLLVSVFYKNGQFPRKCSERSSAPPEP